MEAIDLNLHSISFCQTPVVDCFSKLVFHPCRPGGYFFTQGLPHDGNRIFSGAVARRNQIGGKRLQGRHGETEPSAVGCIQVESSDNSAYPTVVAQTPNVIKRIHYA
jgi:hypothetical protein